MVKTKKFLLHRLGTGKVLLSRSRWGNFGIFLFLLLLCAFMALPMVYAIIQSIKPLDEIFLYPPRFFVRHPTFDNFRQVVQLLSSLWVPFSRYIFNSCFVTVLGTLLYMVSAAMAGYALGKGRFYGKKKLSVLVEWAMLFRGEVMAIPVYMIICGLGIVDTYWSLIIPPLSSAMGVFLIRQFTIVAIPDSTLEAARIDGASEYTNFFKIAIPSIRPALLTVMIFTFQTMWSSSGTQQYIYSENLKDLPAALSTIAASGLARAGAASAVSVILMIPPIIVFLISQSSVMETMTHSGLK